jgi:secreted PhoX family phosphatase
MTDISVCPSPVMPDKVTSYGTDDGTQVMWLRFVSTEEGKFDEGELFCAQLVQNTPCADVNVCQGYDETNPKHKDGPASAFHASVSWLSMGKAKASEIKLALTDFNKTGASVKFSDMFEFPKLTNPDDPYYGTIDKNGFNMTDPALDSTATPKGSGAPCAKGFVGISTGGKPIECLKVKKGKVGDEKKAGETIAKLASRLETRRYAAVLGCNTEMEKWEGSAYDPIAKVMYTAISNATGSMAAKNPSGNGKPQDAIRIPKTASCGCVMETGFAESTYKTSYIKSHLCGSSAKIDAACNESYTTEVKDAVAKDPAYGKKQATFVCDDYLYNQCNKSEIANPDNLALMTEFGQLVIMEDTKEGHRNDAMWIQNLSDGKKTRVMTGPLGCEITGAMWFPNLGPGNNGQFSYLGVVVQHPYDESDGGGDTKAFRPNDAAMRGYVGVLGPLKKVNRYVSAASSFSASMIVSFVSVLFVSLFVF